MCSPSAPDTSRADANAAKITELSQDQFNWVKDQWAAQAPDRANATARANTVSDLQIDAMRKQNALGDEAANDYRTIYKPLEQKNASQAASYDTEAHREELAGKARTDVQAQMAAARAASERSMASMGVNPSDPAAMSMNNDLARDTTLMQVGAGNKARADATTMGHALTMDAIGVGRGVVGSQATSAGLALNQGNSSVANSTVPVQVGQSGVGMVNGASQAAISGLGTAGNIYQNSARLNTDAANASSSTNGALAGAAMTAVAVF